MVRARTNRNRIKRAVRQTVSRILTPVNPPRRRVKNFGPNRTTRRITVPVNPIRRKPKSDVTIYRPKAIKQQPQLNPAEKAYQLSLRFPRQFPAIRIPSPYQSLNTAVCKSEFVLTATTNAAGTFILAWNPILNNQMTYYNSVALVNGTPGTAISTCPNAFLTSGTSVYEFPFRIVSAEIEYLPIQNLMTAQGTVVSTLLPEGSATWAATGLFDNIRSRSDAVTTLARDRHRRIWSPKDEFSIRFIKAQQDSDQSAIVFLLEGFAASSSVQFKLWVNYEFIPTSSIDYFNTQKSPIGNPTVSIDSGSSSFNQTLANFANDVKETASEAWNASWDSIAHPYGGSPDDNGLDSKSIV